jgi:hypothetical protein
MHSTWGRVQRVELALVVGLLGEQTGDNRHRLGTALALPGLGIKLAVDIAIEPTEDRPRAGLNVSLELVSQLSK